MRNDQSFIYSGNGEPDDPIKALEAGSVNGKLEGGKAKRHTSKEEGASGSSRSLLTDRESHTERTVQRQHRRRTRGQSPGFAVASPHTDPYT